MTTRYAQYSPSASSVNATGSTVGFGTDLSQDAAYLSGTVTNSRAFCGGDADQLWVGWSTRT